MLPLRRKIYISLDIFPIVRGQLAERAPGAAQAYFRPPPTLIRQGHATSFLTHQLILSFRYKQRSHMSPQKSRWLQLQEEMFGVSVALAP